MRFVSLSALALALPLCGCLGLMAETPRDMSKVDQFQVNVEAAYVACLREKTPIYAATADSASDVGTAILGACANQGHSWKMVMVSECRKENSTAGWARNAGVDAACAQAGKDLDPKLKEMATSVVVEYRAAHPKR